MGDWHDSHIAAPRQVITSWGESCTEGGDSGQRNRHSRQPLLRQRWRGRMLLPLDCS